MSNRNLPNPFHQIRMRLQLATLRLSTDRLCSQLKANFNPSQPRVPAGKPDGGRWTDGGVSRGHRSSKPDEATQQVIRDRTGEQPWSSYVQHRRADGSLLKTEVINRDGSKILVENPTLGVERNTVTLHDGARFVFENSGAIQRVFDGRGQVLSETLWTPRGPMAQPIVQQVFDPGKLDPRRTVLKQLTEAGIELYNWWLSSRDFGEEVIFSFRADKLLPVPGEPPLWTSKLSREEVEEACPRFRFVQSITNQVAKSLNPALFKNRGAFGTAVHMGVKRNIDGIRDPNFTTEVSIFKSDIDASRYALRGTVRIDILEKREDNFVCVYDLKTGAYPMPPKRFLEIYMNVIAMYPKVTGVIIAEVRPTL